MPGVGDRKSEVKIAFFVMKHFENLIFFSKGTGPFFNGHLKPKIVKIGPVMNSGGAAQNMKIFFIIDG